MNSFLDIVVIGRRRIITRAEEIFFYPAAKPRLFVNR